MEPYSCPWKSISGTAHILHSVGFSFNPCWDLQVEQRKNLLWNLGGSQTVCADITKLAKVQLSGRQLVKGPSKKDTDPQHTIWKCYINQRNSRCNTHTNTGTQRGAVSLFSMLITGMWISPHQIPVQTYTQIGTQQELYMPQSLVSHSEHRRRDDDLQICSLCSIMIWRSLTLGPGLQSAPPPPRQSLDSPGASGA